jgi:hypothetical protein
VALIELAVPLRGLTLAAGILLLLARLGATALLLTGLLARILVLLAGVLILVRHLEISSVERRMETTWNNRDWLREHPCSMVIFAWRMRVAAMSREPPAKASGSQR